MIDEKEINISNKSYTNKDFASIYPELIDLIHNYTTKWDPQTSNESDPGVVITKEIAFLGDKLNYNIDKNVLETFMPSCTQETSMRQNCESRGYEMGYFNAAETTLTFTYTGDDLEEGEYIHMSKFKTKVTSSDESVYYVLTRDVDFNKTDLVVEVPAIEGDLEILTVASATDETLIQLSNLDDNNRIYFPVRNVAQNGVFISNDRADEWKRTKNLNTEELGMPFYKFGYDSRKALPYVEFPRDIANIIGSGLTIRYITTKGKNGNVSANYLTVLASSDATKNGEEEFSFNVEDTNLYIRNNSAAIGGRDPETIDEAYESYKRTVGVFDTLVTCRDYESAIYNMYSVDYPVVSNIHVSDRRDDINYSTGYVSYDENGIRNLNYNYIAHNNGVTAYDLILYPLNYMKSYSLDDYYTSFKPLLNTTYIQDEIELTKCVSHDYKSLIDADIYAIKNYARLNARVVTTYKVNNYERAQIIQNIQQELIKHFNAREVSYGQEIPYDIILKVIENADERIATVALSEPELVTYYMNSQGDEVAQESYSTTVLESGINWFTIVLAKNILNGRVSLLNFDDSFNFDLNQISFVPEGDIQLGTLSNLKYITSNANINLTADTYYTLLGNEVVQLVGPNLIDEIEYTAYIYYRFLPANTSTEVTDGTSYKLRTGDYLHIYYVDSNKNAQLSIYGEGTIIKPTNLTLVYTSDFEGGGRVKKTYKGDGGHWYASTSANQSIAIQKVNATRLGKLTNCYWLRNSSNNDLFEGATIKSSWSSSNVALDVSVDAQTFVSVYDYGVYTFTYNGTNWTYDEQSVTLSNIGVTIEDGTPVENDTLTIDCSTREIILGDNEYFFYSDEGYNTLVTIGSGTTISTNMSKTFNWKVSKASIKEIIEKGLLQLKEYWVKIEFTYDNNSSTGTYLDIQENSIITLTEGDSIKIHESRTLSNDLVDFDSDGCYYTIGGVEDELPAYDVEGMNWRIKSRLDINASKTRLQRLYGNQSVTFIDKDDNEKTIMAYLSSDVQYLAFNLNLDTNIAGGTNIDVTSLNAKNEIVYPLTYYGFGVGNSLITRDATGMISLKFDSNMLTKSYFLADVGEPKLLMLYWIPDSSATLTISGTGTGTITLYPDRSLSTISNQGIYILNIPTGITTITFTATVGGNLIIDTPRCYDGYNPQLGIEDRVVNGKTVEGLASRLNMTTSDKASIYASLESYIANHSNNNYYYSLKVDNSNAIESDDLSSPYALFDYNNFANKCVIEEIDIENSDIDIARSSRK